MSALHATEPLDRRRHQTAGFTCGRPPLDAWLQRYAGQGQRRDTARTFVTARPDGTVAGYYTLVAGQVEHQDATPGVSAGAAQRFPIPICLIARLAVAETEQGRGIGADLLLDALRRILAASQLVGIRAAVVHAIDDDAARFYARFGFAPLAEAPRTLMVPLHAVRTVLAP